ncbi:hypothetical protein JRO89_XS15G0075400 [Xanthoceras sorbifolium]|uniref:Uncharacterized protein n=1 Tax=Xanthoceras sorbifolium TaxID=99658 RepID=A0ABQ8H1A6_9ROSI|nr:hypothetical protein JRO89_XS15G0075400 [Xanthoceras sorbifolium]
MTPFQALYGRLPPTIPHYMLGTSPVHEVGQNLASRDEILCQLKNNLHATINRMKELSKTTIDLPLIADDGEIVVEPEAILDTRWVKKGSRFVKESIVQWKRLPWDDAT